MQPADLRNRLVDHLIATGYLRSPHVIDAFRSVPREEFAEARSPDQAYEDNPLPIGSGQTISAPHMVAIMMEALEAGSGMKVLDVGSGSGYHAAIIAHIVGHNGIVHTVEYHERLTEKARRNLERAGVHNVVVTVGDGAAGKPDDAPFDRINVAAAAPDVPPPLLEQLADDGILLIPLGRDPSRLVRVQGRPGGAVREDLGPCAFVPMSGPYGF